MDYFSVIFILATSSLIAIVHTEESNGHAVGNVQSNHPPPIKLDPKLRRALLRVLTKLENEENNNKDLHFDKMQVGNIVTEEDFISYFNSKDAQTQLFDSTSKEEDKEIKIDNNYKRAPGEHLKFSLYDPSGQKHDEEEILNGPLIDKFMNEADDEMRKKMIEELSERVKFVSTEPSPQDAIFFQIPHPIEIPTSSLENSKYTNDSLNTQETRSILASQNESRDKEVVKDKEEAVSENEVAGENEDDDVVEEDEKDGGNSTLKTKLEKHEVEFFGAPLLAAFTVQQDQLGLPRRVIPLDYRSNGGEPIPLPTIKEQEEKEAKERELQEKQRILEQQLFEQRERLRLLQQQQFQPQTVFANSQNSQFKFNENEQRSPQYYEQLRSQQQIFLANQQRQQLSESQFREQQRLSLLEQARQKQQTILSNTQRQEEQERLLALREQERLRLLRQEEELRNQQSFNFQRSVDFQFRPSQPLPNTANNQLLGSNSVSPFNQFQPAVDLNRVNRGESNRFVGNLGINNVIPTPAPTPDAQLQNLIFRSGITGELKTNSQEDLNIISKVLALNHGAQLQHIQGQQLNFNPQQSSGTSQQQQTQFPVNQNFAQQSSTFQFQNPVQQQPNTVPTQNFVQQPQNFAQQPSVSQSFKQQSSVQQNFVQPQNSQNFVQQQTSQNFVQPQNSQNFVQPQTSQNFVQPQSSQNFVQPQTSQNFVQPSQDFVQQSRNIQNFVQQSPQNFVQNQHTNFVQSHQNFVQQPQNQQNFVQRPAQQQNFLHQHPNSFQPNSVQSFTSQQFRPRDQILGQHSSKVSKVVRAPSLVIEPPFA